MTLTYFKVTERDNDTNEDYGYEFEYEADESDVLRVIAEHVFDDYFDFHNSVEAFDYFVDGFIAFLEDGDKKLIDDLKNQYYDQIKEAFEDAANTSMRGGDE